MIKLVKYLLFLLAITAIGYFVVLPKIETVKKNSDAATSDEAALVVVEKVIDGDTFRMANGDKVRLIGIDTPEKFDSDKLDKQSEMSGKDKQTIKKLGEDATEYVKKLVEGKKVTLVREINYSDKDKYGRLLRYVYTEDGVCINAKIIKDGYANVFYSPEISKIKEFKKLETEARENKRGLWKDE